MTWPPADALQVTLADLFLFGQDPTAGAVFYVQALDGWEGAGQKQQAIARAADHGDFAPVTFYDHRKMVLHVWIAGADLAARRRGEARLSATLSSLTGTPMRVLEAPYDRTIVVWPDDTPPTKTTQGPLALWSVPIYAPDPVRYATAGQSVQLTLPQAGAGQSYPITYPVAYAPNSGGDAILSNQGDSEVWPTLRIDGPVTNPVIENVTTGEVLSLSITLGTGEWLDINGRDEIVTLDGTTSRRTAVQAGSLFPTVPSGDSSWQFRSSDTASPAVLTVTYADGWF